MRRMNPKLLAVLVLVSASACKTASVEPDANRKSRTFDFVYKASVDEVPTGAKEVNLWVPVPETTLDQKVGDLVIECDAPYSVARIEHGAGRALCATSAGKPIHVTVTTRVTRYETHGGGKSNEVELAKDREPNKMIPLNGKVAAEARAMKTDEDSYGAARQLYQHVLDRMRYDKPEGQPWGRGDAEWACGSGFGNCTDFHSYFMGLARTKGIPARFEMGFSIPVSADKSIPVKGYHCWAFFWNEQRGWVPIDASEADKAPEKTDYYFGTLDENRVTMSGGRDVVLSPTPRKGALNFFVYPYAEADGVELTKVTRSFEARTP